MSRNMSLKMSGIFSPFFSPKLSLNRKKKKRIHFPLVILLPLGLDIGGTHPINFAEHSVIFWT